MRPPADLPARIGPVEFGMLGGMVAVRCPRDLDAAHAKGRGHVGAGHPPLAHRAAANWAGPPGAPAHHRSAVPAGRAGPGQWVIRDGQPVS